MIASAAPLLAMSLEPTATVLAAAPPMAALMIGMYLSDVVYQFKANNPTELLWLASLSRKMMKVPLTLALTSLLLVFTRA